MRVALAGGADMILAQKLVDDAKAAHSNVVTMGIHAKRPNSADYVIIAHTNHTSVGHKSEGADLVTLRTGEPDGPNALPGGVYDVGIPLHDRAGKMVGFLATHLRPDTTARDPKAEVLKTAFRLRDELAKHIPSAGALFQVVH
jgi:hypothetical protein